MKRRLRTLAVAVAAVGVLGACTSNPSARTVAEDMIDGLPDDELSDERRQCFREQLDLTPEADLEAVAAGSEAGNFGPEFDDATVSEGWRAFVARLQEACP